MSELKIIRDADMPDYIILIETIGRWALWVIKEGSAFPFEQGDGYYEVEPPQLQAMLAENGWGNVIPCN